MLTPTQADHQAVEARYGKLPADASEAEQAHHYRLAQATALIRRHHTREVQP